MAQSIQIAGATYSDVPAINVPKPGGGTAVFADPSPTTAQAGDVAAGKLFLSDQGVLTEGTGSGGGGGTEITAAGVYTINAGDTITLGSGLKGSLEAFGQRVLTNSWDFTEGLTDSVGGVVATLVNATRSSAGITIDATNEYANIPIKLAANKTYEIDFASLSKTFSSGHGRVFMWTIGNGLILQSGANWNVYNGVSWDTNNGSDKTAFSGKTLRMTTSMEYACLCAGTQRACVMVEFYVDGTLWYKPTMMINLTNHVNNFLRLGSDSQSFADMVITGFRIYDGVIV